MLRVTDSQGESGTAEIEIKVGNDPPQVAVAIDGNRSFFWDKRTIDYQVKIADKEDGTLASGISPADVRFSINYLPQGQDITEIAQGHQTAGPSFEAGRALIEGSDCKACHAIDKRVLGPSYLEVADRYKGDAGAVDMLAKKVITGGSGNWGDREMSAHPQLSNQQAQEMVRYVLSLANEQQAQASQPLQGTYVANEHAGKGGEGSYIFTVSYTDQGGTGVGALAGKEMLILRHPRVQAEDFDTSAKGVGKRTPSGSDYTHLNNLKHGSFVSFKDIDLTDVSQITYRVAAQEFGGAIEVRVGSPTGKLISTATVTPTGGGEKWVNVTAPVTNPGGVNELFFVFTSGEAPVVPDRNLFHLDWIQFNVAGNETTASR